MNAKSVRLLQMKLSAAGFDPGGVDGRLGSSTYAAVAAALLQRVNDLPPDWAEWSGRRQTVLYLQALCRDAGLETGDLDGRWGPQTEFAASQLAYLEEHDRLPRPWRDERPLDLNPNHWPSEGDLAACYGPPGSGLVTVALPYPLRLSWQLSSVVNKTSCHVKVRDSLLRVLDKVLAHYGADGIRELRLDLYGGGFNLRRKRGGTAMSTHAWGIAFDFDPDHNKLEWGRGRAAFARPEYDVWWRCWEEEGWSSLGRIKNFDWMHVQAAKP